MNTIKIIYSLIIICFSQIAWTQQDPAAVNCNGAVPGCNLPNFYISTNNSQNIPDFGIGGVSNPQQNPNSSPGNSGCLLSGETTSTFITIDIISSGTLEWSINAGQTACLDWIMWPNTPTLCSDLPAEAQPPIACNWNGMCGGYTGMCAPGNLPAGASQWDFENALNVVAGDSYMLCLSNYSQISSSVDFSFFGTADVSCTPGTQDQTICLGTSATVDVQVSAVLTNPTYNWLVTTGVSDPNSGVGVIVTPVVSTQYIVEVDDPNLTLPITDTFWIYVQDPHTPSAGLDQNVCFGDPILLSGVASDPVNNAFGWSHDVSLVSPTPSVNYSPNPNSLSPTVNVNQLGQYYFIFRESNEICGDIEDTMIVNVSDLAIDAYGISPTCAGNADGEIHITSLEAVEYSFDGGASWVADSFQVGFQTGTYTVCAQTATGCSQCTDVNIVVPPPVVVSVSNDTLICENGTAYLSASATGGNSYLFHWDNTPNTASSQSVEPSVQTSYTVYAENEYGCLSQPQSIEVSIRPPLTGTISMNDTVCPGYSTNIEATVFGGIGAPYDFVWSTGDSYSGNGIDGIYVSPLATSDYTVTITDGCESTPLVLTTNVRVSPLPVPEYQVLDPIQCEPAIFHIVNTTDPAMSEYVYWELNGYTTYLNQDTIVSPEYMYGNYELYLMITSYEGCIDSIRVENALSVDPLPNAYFMHSPNPVTMFNTTVEFQNMSFNAIEYQWYFEEGYPSSSSYEDPTISFPEGITGEYEVVLIATSDLGCVDTMVYELVVMPEIIIYAPNSFTPDDDEYNPEWRVFMEGVDIYDWELFIYNRWGQVIWESHDIEIGWDGMYNGNPVEDGTYLWVIRTKDVLNDNKLEYSGHINVLR